MRSLDSGTANPRFRIWRAPTRNGTRVNGEATSVRVLEPGDNIEVGDIALQFSMSAAQRCSR